MLYSVANRFCLPVQLKKCQIYINQNNIKIIENS